MSLVDSYKDAIGGIVAGIGLQKSGISSLQSACNKGNELQKLSAKLEAAVSEAFAIELVAPPGCAALLQHYDELIDNIASKVGAFDLNPVALDETIDEALIVTSRALEKIKTEIETAQAKRKDAERESRWKEEEEARRKERLREEKESAEQRRLKEEEEMRRLAKEREDHTLAWEQAEADQKARSLQEAVDNANNWRNGIVAYSKRRFSRLVFAVIGSAGLLFLFSSWSSLPPTLGLLLFLAGIIGPLKLDGLSKARLADKNGKLLQFDNTLGFEIGGMFSAIQIVCGVLISLVLWILGKPSSMWHVILPIGWRGVGGFLITMPCALIVAWLWGGFYAGVAAKRILVKHRISDLLAPGESNADSPPAEAIR